jgi:hypothetical protein
MATTMEDIQDEPLLAHNPDRFCMFPIKYMEVWEMYKKAEASFWTGECVGSVCGRCALLQTVVLGTPSNFLMGTAAQQDL